MKTKNILYCVLLCIATTYVNAASVKKSCVAINEIENKAFADDAFFKTMMERLQNAIVNTGKYDVVDRRRLNEIANELEIEEKQLTDDALAYNLKLATISIHGSILSMTKTSKVINLYNQKYTQISVVFELTIRFQDLRNNVISKSKQLPPVRDMINLHESATIKNTSGVKKITKIVSPEKTVKDPKTGKVYNIPAKTEDVFFTPEEEILYNRVMQKAVDQIVEQLIEFSFPAKVTNAVGGKVYINLPEERAKLGEQYEVLAPGEKIIDPDTGEVLDSTEERVLIVQIATVRPRFAIAVPVLNGGDIKKVKRGMIVRKLDPNVPSAHDYVPGNSGVVRQFEQQPQSSPRKKRTLIRN